MDKEKRLQELFNQPRMFNNKNENMQRADYLYEMIKEYYKPDFTMVEVGSFSGGSTELFALNVKKVFSVDPYADNDNPIQEGLTVESALENLKEAEKIFIEKMKDYQNVIKIRKLSMDAVNDFEDNSLDAIYIDGNHKYDSVCNDIEKWYPKIKDGGIISGHDYYQNVKLAVDNTIGKPLKVFKDWSWLVIKGQEKIANNKNIIYIKTTDTSHYGLFANIFQVISVLFNNEKTYIDFQNNGLYYDSKIGLNFWEYYFEQPCRNLNDIYNKINSREIVNYKIDQFNSLNFISIPNGILQDSRLKRITEITREIKIKENIQQKINDFYNKNMAGYNILGVQKRGTDLTSCWNTAIPLTIDIAFKEVDSKINNYDKLFLITDENKTVEKFREKYKEKLIHYDNAILSNSDIAIHRGSIVGNNYKIGEDAIIEAELLSKVNYLLAMNSNMSLWAILRRDKPYSFIDSHIEYK